MPMFYTVRSLSHLLLKCHIRNWSRSHQKLQMLILFGHSIIPSQLITNCTCYLFNFICSMHLNQFNHAWCPLPFLFCFCVICLHLPSTLFSSFVSLIAMLCTEYLIDLTSDCLLFLIMSANLELLINNPTLTFNCFCFMT